jgi:hypothetical protein
MIVAFEDELADSGDQLSAPMELASQMGFHVIHDAESSDR